MSDNIKPRPKDCCYNCAVEDCMYKCSVDYPACGRGCNSPCIHGFKDKSSIVERNIKKYVDDLQENIDHADEVWLMLGAYLDAYVDLHQITREEAQSYAAIYRNRIWRG